ncbi:nucleic acid-binding protein [Ceraceosorus guamensis]|uniref:Nucleic acid-binding protein n=1 Tax=Ceraceosorus guamensis TaxID=1522189 RepID=A0A316VW57_9BASI|nr:nucleic acid-binding protein [Ceraceosorus guamensis]PWN41524.1 nucleic acid-binding protein [Ceraceosorus guamensis]
MSFLSALRSSAGSLASQQMPARACFSSSATARDLARMQLLGRLTADPEIRPTKAGKEYARYTVATTDPLGPPDENGERPPPTTSYHKVFAFGDNAVQRLQNVKKGFQVLVDADFRISRLPGSEEEGGEGAPAQTNILIQHRSLQVVSKPRSEAPPS